MSTIPQMKQKIKCGKCFECREMKRDEYIYRAYWEAKDTWRHNGYIIFDTLTYRDEELPHIKDFLPDKSNLPNFSCFNNNDYVKFVKRLRMYISRKYGKHHHIRIFTAAEYGTSDKGTHRPHYHILVYYYNDMSVGNIQPTTLSYLIHSKWNKGRTDGIIERGPFNFLKERCFDTETTHELNVVRYIAKYTEKDSSFERTINERINQIFKYNDYNTRLAKLAIKRVVKQYSRIPQKFGAYALEQMNLQEVYNTNKVSYPDTRDIVKSMPLPDYYRRKLYYKLEHYQILGKNLTRWKLTEFGKQHENDLKLMYFVKTRQKIHHNILNSKDLEFNKPTEISEVKLTNYQLYYRNRISNLKNWKPIHTIAPDEKGDFYYNFTTPSDIDKYGIPTTCRKLSDIGKDKYHTKNIIKKAYFDKDLEIILNRLDEEERQRKKILQINYENTKALERRARMLGMK